MIEIALLKLICLDNNFAQKEFLRFLPDFQNSSGAVPLVADRHGWQSPPSGYSIENHPLISLSTNTFSVFLALVTSE